MKMQSKSNPLLAKTSSCKIYAIQMASEEMRCPIFQSYHNPIYD